MSRIFLNTAFTGIQKLREWWPIVRNNFLAIMTGHNDLEDRLDAIITTPAESVSAQEIIDARKGKANLRAKIDTMDAGISQRNILHNWDFRNPVNQRGLSNYNGGQYCIDRYILEPNCALLINNGSIELTATAINNNFYQLVENFAQFAGQIMTLSVDGYVEAGGPCRIACYDGSDYHVKDFTNTIRCIMSNTFTVSSDPTQLRPSISSQSGNDKFRIYRMKLELGAVSTLANDPPADYGEQLALCQRYYQVGGLGFTGKWQASSVCFLTGIFPVQMRIAPTMILLTPSPKVSSVAIGDFTGDGSVITGGGTDKNGLFYISIDGFTGATPNDMCQMSGNYLAFSADL